MRTPEVVVAVVVLVGQPKGNDVVEDLLSVPIVVAVVEMLVEQPKVVAAVVDPVVLLAIAPRMARLVVAGPSVRRVAPGRVALLVHLIRKRYSIAPMGMATDS